MPIGEIKTVVQKRGYAPTVEKTTVATKGGCAPTVEKKTVAENGGCAPTVEKRAVQCCYLLFLLPRHSDNSSNICDLRHKIILSDYVAYDKYTALEVETQLDVQSRSRNCMFCSPSTCSHLSNLSNWTVYTEVGGEGPRCFIGGTTQFVRAGGSPVPVEDVRTGDQLEDPGTPAYVEAMTPNVSYRGTQVVLTINTVCTYWRPAAARILI